VGERWLALSEAASRRDGHDHQYRIPAGYDRVTDALAARLPAAAIRLATVVRDVEWGPGRVVVHAGTATAEARAAIITLPLGVLTAPVDGTPGPGRVRPDLGSTVRGALDGIADGIGGQDRARLQDAVLEALPSTEATVPGMIWASSRPDDDIFAGMVDVSRCEDTCSPRG